MTLDKLLEEKSGMWDNNAAWVLGAGGYYIRVANGTADKFTLTEAGSALLGDPVAKPPVAPTVVDMPEAVVQSGKPRGRKAPFSVNDLDLE